MIYVDNDSTYSQRIYIPRNDDFDSATGHTITLQSKDYTINQNGITRIHPDAGFDGISGGTIGVYVSAATGVTFEHLDVTEDGIYVATGDTAYSGVTVQVYDGAYQDGFADGYASGFTSGETEGYSSGHTEGMEDQKALLSSATFTQNGDYTSENGLSGVTVNVDQSVGYASGFTDGKAAQKALLTDRRITSNGTFTSENGYSAVTVDVNTVRNQSKSLVLTTADTAVTVTYDSGYTGLENVNITKNYTLKNRANLGTFTENGDQGIVLDDYTKEVTFRVEVDSAGTYTQGYNDGYADGYTSGETDQRALLSSITITQPYTSVTSQNGFSGVTVDVPMGSLVTDAPTQNGSYDYYPHDFNVEGFGQVTINVDNTSVYNSGVTDGYISGSTDGYASGKTDQKALMTTLTLDIDGVVGGDFNYTRENGWDEVQLHVSGLTKQAYSIRVVSNYLPGLLNSMRMDMMSIVGTPAISDSRILQSGDGQFEPMYITPGYKIQMTFDVPPTYNAPNWVVDFTYLGQGWITPVTCNTTANIATLGQFTATTVAGSTSGYDTLYANANVNCMVLDNGTWVDEPGNRNPSAITFTNNKWVFNYSTGDTVAIQALPTTAFSGDTDLKAIEAPISVTKIGNRSGVDAFIDCESLESVYAPGVVSVGHNAFVGCHALSSVTFSQNMHTVNPSAFRECHALTTVDTSKVLNLGVQAFWRCLSLKEVDFSSVEKMLTDSSPVTPDVEGTLAHSVCFNCESLTAATIGDKIDTIGGACFENCTALTSITCYATTAPALTASSYYRKKSFYNISPTGVLHVPSGSDYSSWISWLGSGWTVSYI